MSVKSLKLKAASYFKGSSENSRHPELVSGSKNKGRPGRYAQQKAFTLAEVLIALVIIGVIAAITIPVLTANTKTQEISTAAKKYHAELKQAVQLYYVDNGTKLLNDDNSDGMLYSRIKPYLSILKDCGRGWSSSDGCVKSAAEFASIYKTYNGRAIDVSYFDDGQMILADGKHLFINNGMTVRLTISIDVNGINKGPNRLGRDLLSFHLNNGELLPMGVSGSYFPSESFCSNTSANGMNGAGCTFAVLQAAQ